MLNKNIRKNKTRQNTKIISFKPNIFLSIYAVKVLL